MTPRWFAWLMPFAVAGAACGTRDQVQLSAADTEVVNSLLRADGPCSLFSMVRFRDGGSMGGGLVDADGDTIYFCLDQRMETSEPRLLYLGKLHCGDPGAIGLPVASHEERALVALIQQGIDGQFDASAQQRLREIPRGGVGMLSLTEEERRAWDALELIRLVRAQQR